MTAIVPPYLPYDDLAARLPPGIAPWARWFSESGVAHQVDRFTLAAICLRESGGGKYLTPPDPTGTGDSGNGLGLMQIDRRYWAAWADLRDDAGELHLWQVPRYNIDKGAEILRANLDSFDGSYPAAIASYNASSDRVLQVLAGLGADYSTPSLVHALDQVTTGKDYVSWVLAHRDRFLSTSPVPPKPT